MHARPNVFVVNAALLAALAASPAARGTDEPTPAEIWKLAVNESAAGVKAYRAGDLKGAAGHFEASIKHYRALKEPRHTSPQFVTSLNNMGFVLRSLGREADALKYSDEALALDRTLYPKAKHPDGHPDLAASLNNVGLLLRSLGRAADALKYYDEALAMFRTLYPKAKYPDGHPDLATSLINMGAVLESLGRGADAAKLLRESIAMQLALMNRAAGLSSDATLRASLKMMNTSASFLLSNSSDGVESEVADYALLWGRRAALLRVLRTRHDAALAAADPAARDKWSRLAAVRGNVSRLLTEPSKDYAVRDKILASLADEQSNLERDLAPLLPELKRDKEMAELAPKDLAAKLPADSAFVEFVRYARWQKGKQVGWHYAAFVVAPGKPTAFVQLDDAKPIDEAVAAWRKHIDINEASLAPAKLRELVWDKVAKHFPEKTNAVFVCPDGDLSRMPFAALPGKAAGTVLLDDVAIAVVPSGPFLLEHLLYPQKDAADTLFAAGDIDYGSADKPSYTALTETGREARRVREAFGLKADDLLAGSKATPKAVADGLKSARYAHVATHGYFDAAGLTEERQREREYLKTWKAGLESSRDRVGLGGRNPLGYVGLALANANDPKAGGILSGLDIVDLPLEGMKLCVLSACETGLGDLTDGEGVAGLQRAFHVAGCPNVIGSLWNVNDKATAALMAQFYHELRVNKKPIIEALREAQLTVYRHPERIDDLAGDRGRPALDAAAKLGAKATEPKDPKEKPKTTPTKLWAAFVLSGLGR